MKSVYLALALLTAVFACKKESPNEPNPNPTIENKDWYILTAPEAREIKGVYGDIDGNLVITDGKKIFKTTDQGKTWKDAGYNSNIGLFGFATKGDTLLALNTLSASGEYGKNMFAKNPHYYSVDQGSSWSSYERFPRDKKTMVSVNRVKSGSGIEYSINWKEVAGYSETIGIETSLGKTINLPAKHQIVSLFLDAKSRLYVSASAALCGSGAAFAYCGNQNGVLYISKNPQP